MDRAICGGRFKLVRHEPANWIYASQNEPEDRKLLALRIRKMKSLKNKLSVYKLMDISNPLYKSSFENTMEDLLAKRRVDWEYVNHAALLCTNVVYEFRGSLTFVSVWAVVDNWHAEIIFVDSTNQPVNINNENAWFWKFDINFPEDWKLLALNKKIFKSIKQKSQNGGPTIEN